MTKKLSNSLLLFVIIFGLNQTLFSQNKTKEKPMESKMKVEIWSDILCPFCYIGKRNFETALENFEHKEYIEVVWKSFQLDETMPTVAKESYKDYLVINKGLKPDQVQEMLDNVTQSAKEVGLDYHFEKAVMVSSLNAHKLLQFAKTKALGNQTKESLLKAFFTDGKNIADTETLVNLAKEIGLNEKEVRTALEDEKYAKLVKADIAEGQEVGLRGVPFFVLDRKYGVSGAQAVQAFTNNLEKAFADWRKLNPKNKLEITEGKTCTTDKICD